MDTQNTNASHVGQNTDDLEDEDGLDPQDMQQGAVSVPSPNPLLVMRDRIVLGWAGFWTRRDRANEAKAQKQATQALSPVKMQLSPEERFYRDNGVVPEKSAGLAQHVENLFIGFFASAGLIFFTALLGYGNGFFFSGFQNWGQSAFGNMMYIGGFLMDGAATASLIVARRSIGTSKRRFAWGIAGFVIIGLVSATGQYMLYKSRVDIPVGSLNGVPLFGFLFGNSTVEWFIWARALVFHFIVVLCTFLIPSHKIDMKATIKRIQEVNEAQRDMDKHNRYEESQKVMADAFNDMASQYALEFKQKMRGGIVNSTATVLPMGGSQPLQQPALSASDIADMIARNQRDIATQLADALGTVLDERLEQHTAQTEALIRRSTIQTQQALARSQMPSNPLQTSGVTPINTPTTTFSPSQPAPRPGHDPQAIPLSGVDASIAPVAVLTPVGSNGTSHKPTYAAMPAMALPVVVKPVLEPDSEDGALPVDTTIAMDDDGSVNTNFLQAQ